MENVKNGSVSVNYKHIIIVSICFLILIGSIIYLLFNTDKGIESAVEINKDSGLPFVAIYKDVPIWLNPFFAISILLFIIAVIIAIYLWFRISLRNRTNVIIHMPDGKRTFHSFKKFSGDIFKIKGYEKDKDGSNIYYNYKFDNEATETGYFGTYIEYDYGILLPLSRKNRQNMTPKNIPEIFRFVSALLNTQLAVDLLLSQKFKDFVKMMLVVILVIAILSFLISAYNTYLLSEPDPIAQCVLSNSTQNIDVIRNAVTMR